MEHRGYRGTVEYDVRRRVFRGEVAGLKDTITYEADCLERLRAVFRDAIDAYVESCLACEEVPEPPPCRVGERARQAA
jgi:predicted HicB family RNase H-like nuclease